jgi:hypothetical protein
VLQAVDIIAGRLTFLAVRDPRAFRESQDLQQCDTFCIDKELVRTLGPHFSSLWQELRPGV